MLAALLILFFAFFTVFFIPNYRTEPEDEPEDVNKTPQIRKLWGLAQGAMREQKPMKAEKALLTILRFDEKNAAAYNRLGILYAKEKQYKEAIECFEIAQSLDNNASSLHNVGLIYFETGKYEKAAMAFSQAIELEGDQPGRYIAYAKALEQLGERSKAVEALETAYSLSPSAVVLRHLLEIYENSGDEENAENTRKRIEELQAAREAAKNKPKMRRSIIRRSSHAAKTELRAQRKAAAASEPRVRKPIRAVRPTQIIRRQQAQPVARPARRISIVPQIKKKSIDIKDVSEKK